MNIIKFLFFIILIYNKVILIYISFYIATWITLVHCYTNSTFQYDVLPKVESFETFKLIYQKPITF